MTECPEGVKLTRFDSANVKLEEVLAQKLARWAADNLKAIAACDPPLPPGARNRVADNWRPLFQIAHVIGGHWPARVTEAYHTLNSTPKSAVEFPSPSTLRSTATEDGQPSPNGEGVAFGSQCSTFNSQLPADSLLSDIRSIFAQSADGCVFSRDLLTRLNRIPGRTWSDPAKGKPLTERSLARRLQRFGIRPRTVWIGGTSAKGYLRKDFGQRSEIGGRRPEG